MKITIIIVLLCALLAAVIWPQLDHRTQAEKSQAEFAAASARLDKSLCEFHDPLHNTKRCQ
jgi:hypothetical protein